LGEIRLGEMGLGEMWQNQLYIETVFKVGTGLELQFKVPVQSEVNL